MGNDEWRTRQLVPSRFDGTALFMKSVSLRRLVVPTLRLVAVAAFTVSAVACSAANPESDQDEAANALDDDGISADKDAGKKKIDAGADAGKKSDAGTDGGKKTDAGSGTGTKLTWTSIYDEAFAPGTPGHCGNSGCHSAKLAGFQCGATSASCLSGMIAKGLLSTTTPTASILGSTASSPLRWVHTGGPMPADNKTAEPKLGADIEAWVKAGAPGIKGSEEENDLEGDVTEGSENGDVSGEEPQN